MIAGDEEERHLQLFHLAVDVVPGASQLAFILGIALDQIADRQDESGLQEIEPRDSAAEDTAAMAARAVADHGEVENLRRVGQTQVRPRIALLDADAQLAVCAAVR